MRTPSFEELESWAGNGRVHRATERDVAAWHLPDYRPAVLDRWLYWSARP